jgi:hypothetical protein
MHNGASLRHVTVMRAKWFLVTGDHGRATRLAWAQEPETPGDSDILPKLSRWTGATLGRYKGRLHLSGRLTPGEETHPGGWCRQKRASALDS